MIRRREMLAAAALPLALSATGARAQAAWPNRPIKTVVPWPAGGNADVTIRPVLDRMGQLLGQPIVVENRAGGTGTVGSGVVARAAPDGYTLLQLSSTTVLNLALTGNKELDLLRDFDAIGLTASTPLVLSVHPGVPARNLSELLAYAKANPGKLAGASGGVGSTAHLLLELLKIRAGLDITHVPYQGGAPAVADLIGGHVQLYFDVPPTAIPAARDGKVRILGITTAKRAPYLPDVPTFAELGLKDMEAAVWVGMLAPKGTPAPMLAKLNEAMNNALTDANVRQRLATIGADPTPGTPDKLSTLIKSDYDRWSEVVRRANIKPNS